MNCFLPVKIDSYPMKALYSALVHVDLSDMGAASEKKLVDAVRYAVPRPLARTAPQEDAEILNERGNNYYWGKNGVQRNYEKARKCYEQAAIKGNATALNSLGYLYQHSLGVQQDYAKAREYYEQAAAKGRMLALYDLGCLYEYGEGVQQDYTKALEYYQKAADKGYKRADAKVEELRKKLNG